MNFKYSNAFKSNETPRAFYEELNKNIYEQSFENAPNYYAVDSTTPIEYEYPYGTSNWYRVEARVDNIILPNSGAKSGNDYKNFIFKPNFPLEILYGMKFRWKNNIWLVQNTDGMNSDIGKSCVVRRCNNVLRFFNQNGEKVYEPCCMDEVVRFTNTNRTPQITTAKGEYVILVQRNENTLGLKPNDRFLFGTPKQRECLRIYGTGIRNFINSVTDDENSPSLTQIYLEHYQYDAQLDDLEEGFCNAFKKQLNNESENSNFSNDVVEITPNITYLLSGKGQNEQVFEVYLYRNGEKQTDTFIIQDTSVDVPKNKYRITIIGGNRFKVENLGMFMKNKVNITCTSGEFTKTIGIELRGVF